MLKDNEKLWKVKSANLPKTPKGKRNRVAKYTILQIFKHSVLTDALNFIFKFCFPKLLSF